MALTRDFKDTVRVRAERDPIFRAELKAAQLFSIVTAADFFRKVKEDLAALQERIDDPGRAINCILSSYHLHEWIWARWLKGNAPKKLRGTLIRNKSEFINWLELNCPHFLMLRELANGTKHCSPVHSTDKIEGYGIGPYGIGPFSASYLLIDQGESYPTQTRYLVTHTVLEEVINFWNQFFSEMSIG